MNRGEIRDTIRVLLGETVEQGWKDTEINSMINVAQSRVAIDTRSTSTDTTITVVNYDQVFPDPNDSRADGRYAIPDDLLAITDMELTDSVGIKTWPRKHGIQDLIRMYSTVTGGKPSHYGVVFGATEQTAPTRGDIWLRPWPDGNYTAKVFYIQRPNDMDDDNDFSELPEFAHMAICYEAAKILSRKWGERGMMLEMASMYLDEVSRVATMVHQEDMAMNGQIRNVYRRRR